MGVGSLTSKKKKKKTLPQRAEVVSGQVSIKSGSKKIKEHLLEGGSVPLILECEICSHLGDSLFEIKIHDSKVRSGKQRRREGARNDTESEC